MYEDLIEKLRNNSSGFVSGDTVRKAADAIEDLEGKHFMIKKTAEWLAERVPKWIPVTERSPENEVEVLVVRRFLGDTYCPPNTYVETAKYCYGDWVADSDEYKIARCLHTDPLYWMPLPDPPAIDTEEQP